ncbi:hypothetical protein G6O69_22400 [Pseudenhygromyxa sp. WMMC2535]|uniref:hypothetical protein n=1 Tax=Pseudenhygromyxa sp. WMMC2535 TaxID=2712867 RepID=UPI0015518531|nr:hypothetical protein [Pseudenhygromyxa sp. WMMC2535]NVB40608.1 hypothetical protein [Pseudenhygromyxa sp. WMMC2535]
MSFSNLISNLSNVRGIHFDDSSGFLYYSSGANFLAGTLSRISDKPATVVSEGAGSSFSVGTSRQLDNINLPDIKRDDAQTIICAGNIQTRIVEVAAASLDEISTDSMVAQDWAAAGSSVEDPGQFAADKFYVLRIGLSSANEYHYTKLRVHTLNGSVVIDWKSYFVDVRNQDVSAGLAWGGDIRDLVVTDYGARIYLSINHGYYGPMICYARRLSDEPSPEYSGFLVEISGQANLTNPQQIASDGGDTVYAVDGDKLWLFFADGSPGGAIVEGLAGAGVGLLVDVVDSVLQAVIADELGNVYQLDITSGELNSSPAPKFNLGFTPGFLSWADDERQAVLVADRDNKKIMRFDLSTGEISEELDLASVLEAPLPTPWQAVRASDNKLFLSLDTQIASLERVIEVAEGEYVLGIGLIPFQYIDDVDGSATTPAGYYFSGHPNLAFGGTLSLMLNHELAWNNGVSYYAVKVENVDQMTERAIQAGFVDLLWNEVTSLWEPQNITPISIGNSTYLYPVRDPEQLWYNPYLAAKITTNASDTGLMNVVVDFYDSGQKGVKVGDDGNFEHLVMIDNTRYKTKMQLPRIGTANTAPAAGVYPSLECGCLTYATKDDLVEIDYGAWHPQGVGNYSFYVVSGGVVPGNLSVSAGVTTSEQLLTKSTTAASNPIRVGHIIGDCDIANVRVYVGAPSRVTNGFGWVNLSSASSRSFTLLKGPLTHTPWVGED